MSLRSSVIVGGIIMTAFLTGAPVTFAEAGSAILKIAPHCTENDRTKCPSFDVKDVEHLTTGKLSAGDILDIDIVLHATEPEKVDAVRSWLTYESDVLEARNVELTNAIVAPTPGEQNIDSIMRLIKIGGSTQGKITTQEVVIARVTFRVIATTKNTVIGFHDFQGTGLGHTAVNGKATGLRANEKGLDLPCIDKLIGCRGTTDALLAAEPSKLIVSLADESTKLTGSLTSSSGGSSSVSDVNNDETINTGSISSSLNSERTKGVGVSNLQQSTVNTSDANGMQGSSFGLLQVQKVQVTTRDRDIFLGWQTLKSSALKGYNIYYGTVSGRYIQRKSVPSNSTSIVLRDLEPGTTYYLALRAFNENDLESAFSQEVSVTVGKPESSTSPLSAMTNSDDAEIDGNPIVNHDGMTIAGESGVNSIVSIFFLVCAAVGTIVAGHRQMILKKLHS